MDYQGIARPFAARFFWTSQLMIQAGRSRLFNVHTLSE